MSNDVGHIIRHKVVLGAGSTLLSEVNERMKIFQEDMEEIDWQAMQDDLDLEEVEEMARQSEVCLLNAKVARLQELLAESEWERERLERRLREKEGARMEEELRSERYMKKCEFFMEYSKSVTAEMTKIKKNYFLEVALVKKKRKKTILGVSPERETENMNQKRQKWQPKKNQWNPMTRRRTEMNLVRTQIWPGVRRVW